MALLLLVALWAAAAGIVHYSVVFIERPKASWWRASAFVVIFAVANNTAIRFGLNLPVLLHWAAYFLAAAVIVWLLFRLKPFNNVTVAACYVVGRYLLVLGASYLVPGNA